MSTSTRSLRPRKSTSHLTVPVATAATPLKQKKGIASATTSKKPRALPPQPPTTEETERDKPRYADNTTTTPVRPIQSMAFTTSKKPLPSLSFFREQAGGSSPLKPSDPTSSDFHTVPPLPQLSAFDFKFSTGLEEAGKKVLEELKSSSALLQARLEDTAANPSPARSSIPVFGGSSPLKPRKRGRFSDQHKKAFGQMGSIADHYVARRVQFTSTTTDIAKTKTAITVTAATPQKKTTKTPKTLKRKSDALLEKLSTALVLNSDESEDEDMIDVVPDDSPVPKRHRTDSTVAGTPRPSVLNPTTPRPFLPVGHFHGLSRSTVVKHSSTRPSLSFQLTDGFGGASNSSKEKENTAEPEPSTPAKPIAVASPMKKKVLLQSPSKAKIGEGMGGGEAFGTPSPVKKIAPLPKPVGGAAGLGKIDFSVGLGTDKDVGRNLFASPKKTGGDENDVEEKNDEEEGDGVGERSATPSLPPPPPPMQGGSFLASSSVAGDGEEVELDAIPHGKGAHQGKKRVRISSPVLDSSPSHRPPPPKKLTTTNTTQPRPPSVANKPTAASALRAARVSRPAVPTTARATRQATGSASTIRHPATRPVRPATSTTTGTNGTMPQTPKRNRSRLSLLATPRHRIVPAAKRAKDEEGGGKMGGEKVLGGRVGKGRPRWR